jgi:quinol monooxygenase YgiN
MVRALGLGIVLALAALLLALPGGAVAQGGTPAGGGSNVYCIGVIYKVQAGHEGEAEGYLRRLQEETRKEPGNLMYLVHRSPDDPRQFFLYEQYRSKADLATHRASEYFQRYAKNGIQKIAESRTGGEFTPL